MEVAFGKTSAIVTVTVLIFLTMTILIVKSRFKTSNSSTNVAGENVVVDGADPIFQIWGNLADVEAQDEVITKCCEIMKLFKFTFNVFFYTN